MLELVPEVLRWDSSQPVHELVLGKHRNLLQDEYEARLSLFVRAGIGTRAYQMTRRLPDRSLDRFLTAPETVHKLFYGPPTHFRHLLCSLIAECRLRGESIKSTEPVWTALFDYRFDGAEADGGGIEFIEARRLNNGVPIDLTSPQAENAWFGLPTKSLQLTDEETDRAICLLNLGLNTIRNISSPAAELISRYVRVIVLRKTDDDHALVTCSYDQFPGKMGLLNVQSPDVSLCRICDGLLHEAIHSFLYVLEEGRPFFVNQDCGNEVELESPWSGRSLRLILFFTPAMSGLDFGSSGKWPSRRDLTGCTTAN